MSKLHTPLCDLLGTRLPFIQAPMASAATPAMAAAVCKAGALGSLGAAYSQPEAMLRDAEAVRALVARETLPETLAAAGRTVEVAAAYETRSVVAQELEALGRAFEGEVDVALFTSSSMVESVMAALGSGARAALEKVTIVSIGPVTSATLRKHGIEAQVEAGVHTVDGALDALEAWTRGARG